MKFSRPERLFKLWSYSASHRTMLIRSDADRRQGQDTRIEIYLGHVDEMKVRSTFDGLEIWKPKGEELREAALSFGLTTDLDYVYLLSSGDWTGYVISGRPSWREAVRELDAPTLFDFTAPWPPQFPVQSGDID